MVSKVVKRVKSTEGEEKEKERRVKIWQRGGEKRPSNVG